MSTRRARIKAVAALPPRRKNADVDAKNKQNAIKEGFEKGPPLPKTPRANCGKKDDTKSPVPKADAKSPTTKIARTPPSLIPISTTKTPISVDKLSSPSPETPKEPENAMPQLEKEKPDTPQKVSVITSALNVKDAFASPLPKNIPEMPPIPPKVLPSPNAIINIGDSDKRNDTDETSDTYNVTEKVPKTNTENAKEIDVQEKANTNDSGKEKDSDKIANTPLGSDTEKRNDMTDDYSVPSVPESITDEITGMDGIVPLQPAKNVPKPIDLLKNELISEYAEVLFDPIVPLPSPSKVRPKLRPVPRLAPHRRNSIQGSASESEDESRRALLTTGGVPTPVPARQRHDSHTSLSIMLSAPIREVSRTRNDSVSSSISQVQPPHPTSPAKEKNLTKTRRQEMSKRMWRRRRDTAKPEVLTMYDLIFFNPTSNPIVPDQDEVNAKEANAKEEAKRNTNTPENEEDADDPPADDAAPVPQIKLGPNGEIILDEQSLVIKQSDAYRKVSSVVREGSWAGSGGGRYTRAARTAEWSTVETIRFYRALAAIGTDFTLMAPLFPGRTRRDLKLKFKKEEKINGAQVDMALRSATAWDVSRLMDEFKEEREEEKKKAEDERRRVAEEKKAEKERLRIAKEMGMRSSRGAKAMEITRHSDINEEMTGDYFLRRALEERKRKNAERLQKKKEKQLLPPPPPKRQSIQAPISDPNFATLTLINNKMPVPPSPQVNKASDMATITRLNNLNSTIPVPPRATNEITGVPNNIETGSLVVLRVNDPNSPSTTMLQTYIAHGAGKLTPVALPSTFLNSVVGYMAKGTPKSTISTTSSPPLTSPSSVASQESRSCTPGVIQLNPSPAKRQRHSSYTITPL